MYTSLKHQLTIILLTFFLLNSSQVFGTKQVDSSSDVSPNILLITADDMGFDDLSLHGNPFVNTNHLDQFAKQSIQFQDFSVTPVCSTTRAALLTGRDPYSTGVSGVHGGRDYLHRNETLLSDVLQQNSYRTGLWGKWHLGKSEGYFPWQRGFDEAYYSELYVHQNNHGFFNGKPVTHKKWVSDVVTDYAIDFMTRSQNDNKPFFAYVSYLAPHEPWLAPDEFVEPLLEKGLRPSIANLYGMINEMDFHIGRLLAFLEKANLANNTIVIFLSDNGPWFDSSNFGGMTQEEWRQRNPNQLAGNKGQTWQNGIKSPLFIRWPERWPANKVNRYVDVKDIYPTLLEALNLKQASSAKPLHGQSFLNYLEGKLDGDNNRETLIASHDVISSKANFNQWTPIDDTARAGMTFMSQIIGLRNERFKLILNPAMDRARYPAPVQQFSLFDLQQDPTESDNVIKQYPEIAQALKLSLEKRFYQLVHSHDSFLPPVYIIGRQPVSVINGFGAASTSGGTTNKAHHMTNMKQPGDKAKYNIEVLESANYDIYLSQDSHASVGLEIAISTERDSIRYQFNEAPVQKVGTIKLTTEDNWIQLQVVGNNSMKSWSQISHLRRLFLIPEGAKETPNDLHIPH